MSDVVLLDCDDEVSKGNVDSNENLSSKRDQKEEDISTIKMSDTGDDDIMVEYNHNDYADLVGPLKSSSAVSASASVKTISSAPTLSSSGTRRPTIPKRPGSMPPFALFSQEMRAKLQKEDPDIGFGDLGRKLGEMWHALKEEEKEEYRKKARQVAEQRMRTYNEAMRSMSPQKRAMVENQQRMHLNKIKKKRTSGYAIFCSEYRRKLAQEQPDLPFADISKTVADDWKMLSGEKRQSYENRAQRFNMEEERKWQQRMLSQQSQQTRIRQMSPSLRGRGVLHRGVGLVRGRGGESNVYRNSQGLASSQQKSGLSFVGRRGQQTNNSGLVIASVSSLSSSSTPQSNYSLPSGISISKAPDPDINLPKSISISRVEPDIQIVEENIHNKHPRRIMGSTIVTRGRGVSLRGQGGQVRPGPTPTGRGVPINAPSRMSYSRGRASLAMSSRGRGMAISSPVKRMASNVNSMSPGKRMGSIVMSPSPMKRPRMVINNQTGFSVPGAVNPNTLDLVGRLCRICGVSSHIIFRLKDRRELLSKVNRVLNLVLDLESDVQNGYPGVICRKCINLVETFHNFQLTVSEGQKTLLKQVEDSRVRKTSSSASVEFPEDNLVDEPESIGVDPLESNEVVGDLNSILPDTELDTDTFMIKEENIGGLVSCAVATTAKSVVTTSAISYTIAPMTAVFTEAVSEIAAIKVEPSIKSEAGDVGDSTQERSSEFQSVERLETAEIPESPEADGDRDNKGVGDEKNTVSESEDYNLNSNQNKSDVKMSMISDSNGKAKTDPEKESFDKTESKGESIDKPEPEESSDKSDPEKESSDNLDPEKESSYNSEPEKERSDNSGPEKESSDNNLVGNEYFGDLFSDYPSWQQESVIGEDNTEQPMPGNDELDHLDDDPEMMQVGLKGGDEHNPLQKMDKIDDPLFEVEEVDFCLVEDENGINIGESEDPKKDAGQTSSYGPPVGILKNCENEVVAHSNGIQLRDDTSTCSIDIEETKDSNHVRLDNNGQLD